MFKKLVAALLALLIAVPALAGGVPQVPSIPTYSEASQLVGTLNALINQLNGVPSPNGGYAPLNNSNISLGTFLTGSVASPGPLVFATSAQRGVATFTAATVGANANLSVSITDPGITTASACNATILNNPTAGAGPTVSSVTPTANTLTLQLTNATATTTGSVTLNIGFNCFN
jgi:hypothetical protein